MFSFWGLGKFTVIDTDVISIYLGYKTFEPLKNVLVVKFK